MPTGYLISAENIELINIKVRTCVVALKTTYRDSSDLISRLRYLLHRLTQILNISLYVYGIHVFIRSLN